MRRTCSCTMQSFYFGKNNGKIKKTSATFAAEVYKIIYYLCFLVLNLPYLTSFSKKEPKASPTSVKLTAVAPS